PPAPWGAGWWTASGGSGSGGKPSRSGPGSTPSAASRPTPASRNCTIWYAGFAGRPPVSLVHGEQDAMAALAARLQGELGTQVFQPRHGASLDLAQPWQKWKLAEQK